jgi:hypothetical protein
LGLTEVEKSQLQYVTEQMVTSDHAVPGDSAKKPVEKK